jgi:very-short-patch-repair endonuclease
MLPMNDTALLRLAGRQHGLVAIGQLIRLGYSEHHIRWRIRVGILFRVYRGVYAVAGSADTFEFRVMAAVLAAGDGALASHRCAAVLYGLRRIRCDGPAVTVAGRKPPEINGIERHRRDTLTTVDRARLGVIPVTAPAWTLLDLAGGLDLADGAERGRLGGALDDVLVRKLASLQAIERLLERTAHGRVPGAAVLAELVAERRAGKKPSETGLEDELLEIFRAYRLPEPVRQYLLPLPGGGSARLDAAYPDLQLGFEADGDANHKGLLDQLRDKERDKACRLLGWDIGRYTTDDIRLRPAGVADDVMRLRAEAVAA